MLGSQSCALLHVRLAPAAIYLRDLHVGCPLIYDVALLTSGGEMLAEDRLRSLGKVSAEHYVSLLELLWLLLRVAAEPLRRHADERPRRADSPES